VPNPGKRRPRAKPRPSRAKPAGRADSQNQAKDKVASRQTTPRQAAKGARTPRNRATAATVGSQILQAIVEVSAAGEKIVARRLLQVAVAPNGRPVSDACSKD